MLVLSRREGESIVIGNEIVVTVLDVRNGQIRLGVTAPRSLQVHREEIYREVSAANRDALASPDTQRSKIADVSTPTSDD